MGWRNKKSIQLLSITLIAVCLSCSKKYGCTNVIAVNFDSEAEISNHSCYYDEVFTFLISEYRMDALIENNVEYIEVFLNDEFIVTQEIDPDLPSFKVDYTTYERNRNIKLLIIDNNDSIIKDRRISSGGTNLVIQVDV